MFVARTTDVRRERAVLGDHPHGPTVADLGHPRALDHVDAVRASLLLERPEHLHGIDLELAVQPDSAPGLEGERQLVQPLHLEPCGASDVRLSPGSPASGPGRGVGVRRPVLGRDAVVVAEPGQPGLALGVRLDVRADRLGRMPARDPGQLGALEQAHLRRAPAGGAVPDPACLEQGHRLARAPEQDGERQAGDAATDDRDLGGAVNGRGGGWFRTRVPVLPERDQGHMRRSPAPRPMMRRIRSCSRAARAALAPALPCTPPPGCAEAEPR